VAAAEIAAVAEQSKRQSALGCTQLPVNRPLSIGVVLAVVAVVAVTAAAAVAVAVVVAAAADAAAFAACISGMPLDVAVPNHTHFQVELRRHRRHLAAIAERETG